MTSSSEDHPKNDMLKALHIATIGDKHAIELSARNSNRNERLLLTAIVDQYNGDVAGAIQSLKRQLKTLTGIDQAIVADVLAPMLTMRHEYELLPHLATLIDAAGMKASACALRAVLSAEKKERSQSQRHMAICQRELETERDAFIRLRVLQRLGRASYLIKDPEMALDSAAAGAALSLKLGSPRSAAANYSVAYNVHHAITGQFDQARRFAHLWYTHAALCSDASFMQPALIADYEMAVQFGDFLRSSALEEQITSLLLPQQYAERFAFAMSHAMIRGCENPATMRTLLHVLYTTPLLSDGQRALCMALIAVADASQMEDLHARSNLRSAIAFLGRPTKSEPAYELLTRRVARASIAVACALIGDDVRADRLLDVSELRDVPPLRRVAELVRSQAWDDFAPEVRGLAKVFRSAWEDRITLTPSADLTPAEMDVLKLLDQGWTAGRIATETHRSVNTIYNHTRAILAKLEANRSAEAVAIARRRGLLK